MVAVIPAQRIEDGGDRLQGEHVQVGGGDERSPTRRAETTTREGEQRVYEDCEDEVRGEHPGGIGDGARFASWRTLISDVNPTAERRMPKRVYGGCRNASTPVPTNVRQTVAVRSACTAGCGEILLTERM